MNIAFYCIKLQHNYCTMHVLPNHWTNGALQQTDTSVSH